jgi:hypothetical protein
MDHVAGPLHTLVENITKNNRNFFYIAVLLTTVICIRLNNYICFLVYQHKFFNNLEAFNIPLERSWKYLFNGVWHAQKKFKFQLQKKKEKFAVV